MGMNAGLAFIPIEENRIVWVLTAVSTENPFAQFHVQSDLVVPRPAGGIAEPTIRRIVIGQFRRSQFDSTKNPPEAKAHYPTVRGAILVPNLRPRIM